MQSMKSYTPVLILIGLAIIVFGAFVAINLSEPDDEETTGVDVTSEMTAENEVTVESTEQVTEVTAEATAEMTEVTESTDAVESTAEAEETEVVAQNGEPTPTSMSRVRESILIGSEGTPVLQVTVAPQANNTGGNDATPTSLSRVDSSILIGTQVTPALQTEAQSQSDTQTSGDATPTSLSRVTESIILGGDASEETPDASETTAETTPESTPEATEEANVESAMVANESDGFPPEGFTPSVFSPQGPVAERQTAIWWITFILGGVIYLGVVGIVLRLVYRTWRGTATPLTERGSNLLVIGGGIVLPVIVLSVLFALTIHTMVALADSNNPTTLTIDVTGNQWWWEVRYPESGVVTANEIHIPVNEPVRFNLTSSDVIHSFWVPELAGKLDLFPGRTNTFWLEADEPGTYRGQCAEYCGIQHAHMAFLVIAHPRDEFDQWLSTHQQPAPEPQGDLVALGQDIFLSSQCAGCHMINGTSAAGQLGPDLTHIGSRRTLGAGTLENTPSNLAAWITNSQQFKPGNLMPPQDVGQEDLNALVAYLESLQ